MTEVMSAPSDLLYFLMARKMGISTSYTYSVCPILIAQKHNLAQLESLYCIMEKEPSFAFSSALSTFTLETSQNPALQKKKKACSGQHYEFPKTMAMWGGGDNAGSPHS